MNRESTFKKLVRVRPPQVQPSYDLQVGDAIEVNIGPEHSDDLSKPASAPGGGEKREEEHKN